MTFVFRYRLARDTNSVSSLPAKVLSFLQDTTTVSYTVDSKQKAAKAALKLEDDSKPQQWEELGHKFEKGELEDLKRSITEMALSRIEGLDEMYVGG